MHKTLHKSLTDVGPGRGSNPPYDELLPLDKAVDLPLPRHPIHNLAPELLGNVFRHLPDPEFEERIESASFDAAPLLLLRICRHWRSIALSTPYLWTELVITCSRSKVPPDPVAAFRTWLVCAGALPMKVALLTSERKERSDEIMQLLVENLHRLRELRVADSLHASFATHLLLHRQLPIVSPTLKCIDIANGHLSPKIPSKRLRGCIHVPNFETLCLRSPFVLSLLLLAPASLRSLTLDFGDFKGSQPPILSMLPLCSSLERLSVRFHSRIVHALPSNTQLPTLRSLTLNTMVSEDLNAIFHKIDAPCLEELSIYVPMVTVWPRIELIFHGTTPTLRRLSLITTLKHLISPTLDPIPGLLRLPALEHLQFHRGVVLVSMLKDLIVCESAAGPPTFSKLPPISTLVFNRCSFLDLDGVWITNLTDDLVVDGDRPRSHLRDVTFEKCTLDERLKCFFESLGRLYGVDMRWQ